MGKITHSIHDEVQLRSRPMGPDDWRGMPRYDKRGADRWDLWTDEVLLMLRKRRMSEPPTIAVLGQPRTQFTPTR